jgi:hypothetical protein
MKVSVIKKVLALALAVVTAGAMGCSSESGSTGPSSGGEEQAGTARMDLRIGRTTQINKVNYTLTGPNGFSATGSIDVKNDKEAEGSIPNVPVGMPYTLSVNASSTDGNVTCTGSKSGINVTCPGNRERDEKVVKLTCTRNHLGIEWGDKDWRSNARTFFLTAEFKLICAKTDAGVDRGSDTRRGVRSEDLCGIQRRLWSVGQWMWPDAAVRNVSDRSNVYQRRAVRLPTGNDMPCWPELRHRA